MKALRFLFIVMLLTLFCSAATNSLIVKDNSEDLDITEIKSEYSKVFFVSVIVKDSFNYFYTQNMHDNKHTLLPPCDYISTDFISTHKFMLTFLQKHYSRFGNPFEFNEFYSKQNLTNQEIESDYIEKLKRDDLFNNYFLTVYFRYLETKDKSIKGFKPIAKTEVHIDSLVSMASKFFGVYINNPENDSIQWGFTLLNNPFDSDKSKHVGSNMPLLIAFCFDAIVSNLLQIVNEVEICKAQIKEDMLFPKDIYQYYNSMLPIYMEKESRLKELLRSHYYKTKNIQNFELIE